MQTVVGGQVDSTRSGPDWMDGTVDPIDALVRSVLSIGGGELDRMLSIAPDFPTTHFTVFEERGRLPWFRRKTTEEARNVRTVRGNPCRLSFPGNTFDLVGCQFLLDLPLDPVPVIAEAVRVCAPGGQILLQDLVGPPAETWFNASFADPALAEVDRVLRELQSVLFFGGLLSRSLERFDLEGLQVSVQSCPGGEEWMGSIERRLWGHKLRKAVPIALDRIDDGRSTEEVTELFLERIDPENGGNQAVMCSAVGRKPMQG